MAENHVLEYCILNVSASPHPRGIYVRLLAGAAGYEVNYWGDRHARISRPIGLEDGFYRGRIATWNEIDFKQPGVSKRDLEQIDLSNIGDTFPAEVGVNGRIFSYMLREEDHTVFVETRNESGQTLSPKQAGKIFQAAIEAFTESESGVYVEVTVVPDEEALAQILGIGHLKYLKIRLVRPNADEMSADAEAILKEMEEENAKSKEVVLKAAAGEDLKPSKRTMAQAEVGAFNGFVEGKGSDEDGKSESYSTKAHPRVIRRALADVRSTLASLLSVAKDTRIRQRDR